MKSFLSQAGADILKGLKIFVGLAPLLPANPTITGIETLAGIVLNIESIGQSIGLTGPQKLQAASAQIGPALVTALGLAGKTPQNPTLATGAVSQIASGLADFLNAYGAGDVSHAPASK